MRRLVGPGTLSFAAYAAFVLAAAFIFGVEANLAGRDPGSSAGGPGQKQKGMSFDERFGTSSSYDFWLRTTLPHAQERIPGLSPFGDAFKSMEMPGNRRGLVQTPLGFVDLKDARWLEKLPPGLTRAATRANPGRGGRGPGAPLAQVTPQGPRGLGPEPARRGLGRSAPVAAARSPR